jgi:ABC-2 type transport system permease protein
MFDRLFASIVKETLMFWRDPKTRGMLFGLPVIQVLIFGFAATLEVRNVDLAIINNDAGRWSRELIERIGSAEFVGSTRHLDSMAEVTEDMEQRRILLGLYFPADFSRDVVAGRPADLQLIVDGRRANAGQVASSYIGAIVREAGMELAADDTGAVAAPRATVRHWFNPNLNYRWFLVPSLVGTMSMVIALMMTGLSISRERELGTFDQLLVSPSTPLEIMVSKTIPAMLGAGVVGTIITCIAVFGFAVPFQGSILLLWAAMFPFVFSVVGIGLVLSSLTNTQQQSILAVFFMMMPLILTSGFATPVENMPQWLQYATAVNPLKYMLIIIQGSFLKSMPVGDIMANVWPMLLIGTVTFTTATVVVQRRLQ